MTNWLKQFLPLLLVIGVALAVAVTNIDPRLHFAGWDNIHAEFDLAGYAKQVFFGAWNEHQGLGAPAAQAQISEITRLPILWLLNLMLPANLVRYAFIFLMYLVGGVGMYYYLANAWLHKKNKTFKNWLASVGAIFYLLHILTLQQFYISFEMFTVQFAFLPWVLWNLHGLISNTNAKQLFYFVLLQLLIAPSGHTPTVFYLAVLLMLGYSFFLAIKKGLVQATITTLMVGLLTLFVNAYWILPNLYYSFYHADYVAQSRENRLFAPESVWSVREAGSFSNLTAGTHYLFNWSDYSFADGEYQLIFNEWQDHLSQPSVKLTLQVLGVITFLGLFVTLIDKKPGPERFAIAGMFVFCLVFIWIDLFPTNVVVDQLYQSSSFLEAFRNPFTKLSIIYGFLSVLLFIKIIEWLVIWLQRSRFIKTFLIALTLAAIGYVSWPSFQGHFISEKLQITFPPQYQQLFSYLQTRRPDLRLLQLPQQSHVSWEYYDWQFLRHGNGYQGMGFYWFGIPQAFLNRDSDRWGETNDFFYHELKTALDNQDDEQLTQVVDKYNVDLIVVDESKIDPNRVHDLLIDHRLAEAAGFTKIAEQDFLTVYEREDTDAPTGFIVPEMLQKVAGETDRVRIDQLFAEQGNYLNVPTEEAAVWYPWSGLLAHELDQVNFTNDGLEVVQPLPAEKYTLTVPGWDEASYYTPAAIRYQDGLVEVTFPETVISAGDQQLTLAAPVAFEFFISGDPAEIIVFFNDLGAIVQQGQTAYPVLQLELEEPVTIEYAVKPAELTYLDSGEIDATELISTTVGSLEINWPAIQQQQQLTLTDAEQLALTSTFPRIELDLQQNPSINCNSTDRGEIQTQAEGEKLIYLADDFAVNCNGYVFEHLSPTYSYIMHAVGKNYQGRATKFFVSYSDTTIAPEDYLIQQPEFDSYITIGKVSGDPRSRLYLNWETRSFGKQGVNELERIELLPLPLEQLSKVRLNKAGSSGKIANPLELQSQGILLKSLYIANYDCPATECYLGIDQSYDPLWLAVNTKDWRLLPHLRLNNWANIWLVEGEGSLVAIYLPNIISLVYLAGLFKGVKLLSKWFVSLNR